MSTSCILDTLLTHPHDQCLIPTIIAKTPHCNGVLKLNSQIPILPLPNPSNIFQIHSYHYVTPPPEALQGIVSFTGWHPVCHERSPMTRPLPDYLGPAAPTLLSMSNHKELLATSGDLCYSIRSCLCICLAFCLDVYALLATRLIYTHSSSPNSATRVF